MSWEVGQKVAVISTTEAHEATVEQVTARAVVVMGRRYTLKGGREYGGSGHYTAPRIEPWDEGTHRPMVAAREARRIIRVLGYAPQTRDGLVAALPHLRAALAALRGEP